MTQKQKKENIRKQKMIIISGFIILLLIISAIIIFTVLHFQGKNKELSKNEGNILYYNEGENGSEDEEGEDNVLVVGLNENNQTNETNQTNENSGKNENNEGTKTTNKTSKIPYYIKINNQANVVTIYKKDSKGEYTVPVKAMICSIGTATPTSGTYTMSDKYTWRLLQGNVYGQYACRITGHILFHSVPYEKKDKSTLEWWEYDKLGTKASLGCIRLKVEDAKWIYDNCVSGTKVEFYSSSDPGPLGKPTAKKISGEESVRNWDPTDPDANNPWKTYSSSKGNSNITQEANKNLTQNNDKKDNASTNNINNTSSGNVDKVIESNNVNKAENKLIKNNVVTKAKNEI